MTFSESSLKTSERLGSLEAGAGMEDDKTAFPLGKVHSGDENRRGRVVTGSGHSRGSRASEIIVNDGILVSKAIDQEVEIREEVVDDRSTKDLIMGGQHQRGL